MIASGSTNDGSEPNRCLRGNIVFLTSLGLTSGDGLYFGAFRIDRSLSLAVSSLVSAPIYLLARGLAVGGPLDPLLWLVLMAVEWGVTNWIACRPRIVGV